MTPQEWQEIQSILDRALLEPLDRRIASVKQACGDDAEKLAEIMALLTAAEAEDTLLDQSRIAFDPGLLPAAEPPTRVGSYELIRRLGRGGMGEVFLARRSDDVHHKEVAVKLLQGGLESPDLISRFLREREILAQLEHPHIARLLDGGQAPDGRPFLVMEYVVGTPIDRHCEDNELSLEDRLILFEKVCKAIHFAHQNLVVHRDLKPGNILVTPSGEPKLLDFGIAKLLDQDSFPLTLETTAPGRSPMTPAYASPEQLLGERVTTASDVYSLGVLLYVMMTGQKPFENQDRTPLEHLKAISSDEPTKPSASATHITWSRQLDGDLDNIALMALRREPERRYGSAEQLAKDLELYRQGKPVSAQRDTFAYRTSKFIQRNRWAVSSSALALIVLLASTIKLVAQNIEIGQQKRSVTVISDFLSELFENPDPTRTRGTDLSARELLDRGAKRIEKELAGRPEAQATLMAVMARSYHGLGLLKEAERLHRKALEIRRKIADGDDLDVAESQRHLAIVLLDNGDLEEAELLASLSLVTHRRLAEASAPELVESLFAAGDVLRRRNDFAEAEVLLKEAKDLLDSEQLHVSGSHDQDIYVDLRSKILSGLGEIYSEQARYTQAEEHYLEALALLKGHLGEKHLKVAETIASLASLLDLAGRREEGEKLFRQALEIQTAILSGPHPLLIDSQGALGQVLHSQGHFKKAEEAFLGALEMGQQVYGRAHPSQASFLAKLAAVVEDLGRSAEAETLAREALQIRRQKLGNDHIDTAISCDYLAQILAGAKIAKPEEAQALFEEALSIYRRNLESDHPLTAATLSNLAGLLYERGQVERAIELHHESLQILRKTQGDDHDMLATATFNFALLLHREGRSEEAMSQYTEAEAIARRGLRPDHPLLGSILTHAGRLQIKLQDFQTAAARIEEAKVILDANYPAGHGRHLTADLAYAHALVGLDRPQQAEALLRARFDLLLELEGTGSRKTQQFGKRAIAILKAEGFHGEAERIRQSIGEEKK